MMKHRIITTLSKLFVITLLMIAGKTFAQDATQELALPEADREKMVLSPGEGESRYRSSQSAKDSITVTRPAASNPVIVRPKIENASKSPEKGAAKEDSQESILSFNFLYYIIQKYKLQDIVD